MTASPAQIAANRANSQKSTGPRTPEGKERSRANALTHGLSGDGVALPTEDADEVQRRFLAFQAELHPSGDFGRALVGRIALLSVRLERCAYNETAALTHRILNAEADYDAKHAADVEALLAGLAAAPAVNTRRLKRTPEGVDRLIAAWNGLAEELFDADAGWTDGHTARVENLLGHRAGADPISRVVRLGKALARPLRSFDGNRDADLEPLRLRDRALAQLAALISSEVAALREHRARIDLTAIAAARALAGNLALFDPSKEATLARRYEAAAERGLYRALRELRDSEKALAATGNPCAKRFIATTSDELGSFRPAPVAAPPAPEPEPVPVELPVRKVNGSGPKASEPARTTDLRQVSVGRTPSRERNEFSDVVTAAFAG